MESSAPGLFSDCQEHGLHFGQEHGLTEFRTTLERLHDGGVEKTDPRCPAFFPVSRVYCGPAPAH